MSALIVKSTLNLQLKMSFLSNGEIYRELQLSRTPSSNINDVCRILRKLVSEYKSKFKSYVLDKNSVELSITYLRDQISIVRNSHEGLKKFLPRWNVDYNELEELTIELGINTNNYLDSILELNSESSLASDFLTGVNLYNYEMDGEFIYNYLKASSVYNGLLKEYNTKELYTLEEIESSGREDRFKVKYDLPEILITHLMNYISIRTFFSSLDKLENYLNELIPSSQPKNLQKDKNQLEAYHLGFLLYLHFKQYGIDKLNNSSLVFTSYFLLFLMGELGQLTNQIVNDLSMNERDKNSTLDFLKEINRKTPLTPASSPFITKWYKKVIDKKSIDIVNLPDRKNKELETSFDAVIRWSQIKRRGGCAFNLAATSQKVWSFKSKRVSTIFNRSSKTYPSLITTNIINQSNSFKAECLNFYT